MNTKEMHDTSVARLNSKLSMFIVALQLKRCLRRSSVLQDLEEQDDISMATESGKDAMA